MTPTNRKYSYEHANECETTVMGRRFLVWDNFAGRCTVACDCETGEENLIRVSGYLSNDLSVRKAIATCFGLPSFRK